MHTSLLILVLIAYQHTCIALTMINQCTRSNYIHGLIWSLARGSLLYYSCISSHNLHSQVQICEHQFCRTSSNRRRALMFNLSRCNEHKTLCSSVPRSPISFQPLYLKRQIAISFNPFFHPKQCFLILAHPCPLSTGFKFIVKISLKVILSNFPLATHVSHIYC